jgi:hypothetical protein
MKREKRWCLFTVAILLTGSLARAQDGLETFPHDPADGYARPGRAFMTQPNEYLPLRPVDQILLASAECATECPPFEECVDPFWKHRHRGFADYLYLSATDVDITYALPVNALGATGTLTGPAAIVDPDYDSGVRVGGGWAIDDCSSVVATFWNYRNDESDRRVLDPTTPGTTLFLNPVLLDPATISVVSESSEAEAFYDIDFRMADLAYERLLSGGCSHAINLILGARYAQLDQELRTNYSILGGTMIESNIDFDGVGPRLGLDGEWLIGGGFFAYGEGIGNFLVGDFQADFQQQNSFAGVQSQTAFEDDRIVSLLELEMGLGWQTEGGNLRVSSGFYISSWFNAMTMPEVIGAVQARQFNDVSETLTFYGLTTRVEVKF